MNRLITRIIGAPVGLVAALAWSTPSRAQDETSAPSAAVATGQPPQQGRPEGYVNHARTGATLMLTGIVTFGLSYGPAAYVGGDSALPADRQLQIPIAGPWLDLTSRPSCGMPGVNCRNEWGYTSLLMFDGFFQALSAVEVLAGLVEMAHEDAAPPRPKKTEAAGVRVTPAALGAGSYGLTAFGKF